MNNIIIVLSLFWKSVWCFTKYVTLLCTDQRAHAITNNNNSNDYSNVMANVQQQHQQQQRWWRRYQFGRRVTTGLYGAAVSRCGMVERGTTSSATGTRMGPRLFRQPTDTTGGGSCSGRGDDGGPPSGGNVNTKSPPPNGNI